MREAARRPFHLYMTPAHLKELKERYGNRFGVIAYWQQAEGRRALASCEALCSRRGVDAYESAIDTLLTATSPSVLTVLSTEDPTQVTRWVVRTAKQRLSITSRADGKRDKHAVRERSFADVYESGETIECDDDPAELAVARERGQMLREAFAALHDKPLAYAVLERLEYETLYEDLAKKYFRGVSRQAATKRIKSAVQRVELYMRGLGAGEGCGEISAHLISSSWRIDELDVDKREQVSAHLAHCATCRGEIVVQRRALAGVGAFMPLPFIDPGLFGSLLTGIRDAWASLLGRAGEGGGAVATSAGNWQGARPAAGIAALALLLGGGGIAAQKVVSADSKVPSTRQLAAPHALFDPINPPRPNKSHRRRKGKHPVAPHKSAPSPPPAPAPVKTAAPLDNGSSEFLPEAD